MYFNIKLLSVLTSEIKLYNGVTVYHISLYAFKNLRKPFEMCKTCKGFSSLSLTINDMKL